MIFGTFILGLSLGLVFPGFWLRQSKKSALFAFAFWCAGGVVVILMGFLLGFWQVFFISDHF